MFLGKKKIIFIAFLGLLLFSTNLFGFGKFLSPELSLIIPLIFVALVIGVPLALTLRPFRIPHTAVVILAVFGLSLKIYEQYALSSNGSMGWLLWGFAPYILCLGFSACAGTRVAAIGGAAIALVLDLATHVSVFIQPRGSTAGLALIFIPLWSTLVFVPISIFATKFFLRNRQVPKSES